jgi:hypothetical protein
LAVKPERKRTLQIPTHKWENDIKIVLVKVGWENVN